MSRLTYVQSKEIVTLSYHREWPYYGMVLAAQNVVTQVIDKSMAEKSVFAEMLRRFGRADEFHERAAAEYGEYAVSAGWTIGALIQALMRKGDTENRMLLTDQFPDLYADLLARYDAPGGVLGSDLDPHELSLEERSLSDLQAGIPGHTCGHCGRTSYSPKDIENRYCGACYHYCDDVAMEKV